MKTKALNKKLVLSKSTIADLSNKDMRMAIGGHTLPDGTFCHCSSNESKCCSALPPILTPIYIC